MNLRFGIDVETGGFEPGRHALLAIGCWWSTGAGIDRALKVRVQREPGAIVEPDAMRCNGWRSDEQWRDLGAVPLRVAVWQLLDYVESLQRVTRSEKLVAVAHNAGLDWSFIERALLSCGGGTYPVERWEEHVSRHWRCSMRLLHSAMDAGLVAPGSGALDRLIELSRQLPRPGVHDPQDDARYAFNGYEWLLTKLSDGGARLTLTRRLTTMDLTEALKGLAAVQSLLPAIQEQLKAHAVQEAVAGGAAVIVRPEFFPRPVRAVKGCPGHVDPWFGLTQMDWNAEIRAGFTGWYETTEGSGKPKVMINYDAARVWLGQKMDRQRKNREEAA